MVCSYLKLFFCIIRLENVKKVLGAPTFFEQYLVLSVPLCVAHIYFHRNNNILYYVLNCYNRHYFIILFF